MDVTSDYVCSKLSEYNATYKRNKKDRLDEFYVAPEVKAIGTRYENKRDDFQNAVPCLIQCSFPYVSIEETLKSQFRNSDFLKTFLDYNKDSGNGHQCVDGVFTDFCCGSIYKKHEVFRDKHIQIQIFNDEFEVCNPLGSSATIHKIWGIYFTIRNMPNRSKLNNIFLIALINSDDLKTKETDFNNVWKIIVQEGKKLESGIKVAPNMILRGTIIAAVSDNLGANSSLGYVESFNSHHYCRICELPKEKCQKVCEEVPSALRTVEQYEKHLDIVKNSTKVDYNDTKGIKRECALNELEYFNVISNLSVDPMHDILEGIIPFALKQLFDSCIQEKMFTEEQLVQKIQFYDYGTSKADVPSSINIQRNNLNLTASKSLNLFLHIPFILFEFKSQLAGKWICITSLQKIVQIVFSDTVTGTDIASLRKHIFIHLSSTQEHYDVTLLPKHHITTHYPTIIEAMGSVKHLNVIREEAKHQMFKGFAKTTRNFKNLNQTLAVKHQRWMSKKSKNFAACNNKLNSGKKLMLSVETKDLLKCCENRVVLNEHENEIREIKWLQKDAYLFKEKSILLHENNLYEVKKILISDNNYILICSACKFLEKCEFTNSFKIQSSSPEKLSAINFDLVHNYKLYKKVQLNGQHFVISEDLKIEEAYQMSK